MRQYLSISLLVAACAVALISLFGDDSYLRMQSLRRSIDSQQDANAELESKVSRLQSEIATLRFDQRNLEDRARNELGMARANEIIFKFDSTLDEETRKIEELKGTGKQAVSESVLLPHVEEVKPLQESVLKP